MWQTYCSGTICRLPLGHNCRYIKRQPFAVRHICLTRSKLEAAPDTQSHMLAIRHSNDSFEVRSRSTDKWPFFLMGRKLKRKKNWISVLFSWSWNVLTVLQFVSGARRYVLMKVLALNIICRGVGRTCWTVIFVLKWLWGNGVRQT